MALLLLPFKFSASTLEQPEGHLDLGSRLTDKEPWVHSITLMFRCGELKCMISDLDLFSCKRWYLIVRPDTNLLCIGPRVGRATGWGSQACCCGGKCEGTSMNGTTQQQFPCWGSSLHAVLYYIILIGKKGRMVNQVRKFCQTILLS